MSVQVPQTVGCVQSVKNLTTNKPHGGGHRRLLPNRHEHAQTRQKLAGKPNRRSRPAAVARAVDEFIIQDSAHHSADGSAPQRQAHQQTGLGFFDVSRIQKIAAHHGDINIIRPGVHKLLQHENQHAAVFDHPAKGQHGRGIGDIHFAFADQIPFGLVGQRILFGTVRGSTR